MMTLLTVDGIEEIDYMPSDAEIRAYLLDDVAVYGVVISGATWIRRAGGDGFWTVCAGRRVDAVPAAVGWCWSCDGRGYWTGELARIPGEVRLLYGQEDSDDEE